MNDVIIMTPWDWTKKELHTEIAPIRFLFGQPGKILAGLSQYRKKTAKCELSSQRKSTNYLGIRSKMGNNDDPAKTSRVILTGPRH